MRVIRTNHWTVALQVRYRREDGQGDRSLPKERGSAQASGSVALAGPPKPN
jgi:hypothetical protein